MAQIEEFKSRNGTRVNVHATVEEDLVAFQAYSAVTGQYQVFAIDVHTAQRLGAFLAGLED